MTLTLWWICVDQNFVCRQIAGSAEAFITLQLSAEFHVPEVCGNVDCLGKTNLAGFLQTKHVISDTAIPDIPLHVYCYSAVYKCKPIITSNLINFGMASHQPLDTICEIL